MRAEKVHATREPPYCFAVCGDDRAKAWATPATGDVTCLRCLFYLGLYVPLVKLKEHQAQRRDGYTDEMTEKKRTRRCRDCGKEFEQTESGQDFCEECREELPGWTGFTPRPGSN